MSTPEKWFGRIVWIGILCNLCFALPAIFAPDMLLASLDMPPETSLLWLQNVGMLLLTLCIFYAPSAVAPARYPTHTKLVVLARWIASASGLFCCGNRPRRASSGRCFSPTSRLRFCSSSC